MSQQIVYNYGPAHDNLNTTRGQITNMSNAVTDAMTHCSQFFSNMDANVKAAMQDKIDTVMKTGNNALAACNSVNATAGQAVSGMSDTDTGLIPTFT